MIGEQIVNLLAIAPISKTNGQTENGIVIDRQTYKSCTFTIMTGAATGNPTGISIAYKVQEGNASNMSDAADITGASGTITAETTKAEMNLDLENRKRYIRIVATVTLTGGTSPSIPIAAVCTLGETNLYPV